MNTTRFELSFCMHAQCAGCQTRLDIQPRMPGQCESCGSVVEIHYDLPELKNRRVWETIRNRSTQGVWRYAELLPARAQDAVTLGEGATPLLHCPGLGEKMAIDRLFVKDETRNPTGSFKDRALSVAVTAAAQAGVKTLTTSSSGNTGASLAAYAARACIEAIIVVPEGTSPAKIRQVRICGAKIVPIAGDYSDATVVAERMAEGQNRLNVTTTFRSAFATEGDKTVAFEIAEQLGWRAPRWILVPVGSGPLLAATYRGFLELNALGAVEGLPSMVAVQPEGCCPIVRAFREGIDEVQPWDKPNTIAFGINDPLRGYEQQGTYVLRLIRESNGAAIAVSDSRILSALGDLARFEGIFVEPAAASVIAALPQLRQLPDYQDGDTVVCLATGHGLKAQGVLYEDSERQNSIKEIGDE